MNSYLIHLSFSRLSPKGITMKYLFLFLALSCAHRPSGPVGRTPSGKSLVMSFGQLKERLERAAPGERILIDKYAMFDMTNEGPLIINKSVTLEGFPDPGEKDRATFFHMGKALPIFNIKAPKVKLIGLKFEGVEKDAKKEEIIRLNAQGVKGVYQFPVTRGVDINASEVEISNCEFEGFSHAAIFITAGKNVLIDQNYIHHNQRWGLGYGVALNLGSTAKVTRNTFDYNRHSIAGTGHSGQSYEASYNVFGIHHIATPLDMHGGKDRGDKTQIAGKHVVIHHNDIKGTSVAAFIHRGIAEHRVEIYANTLYFKDQDKAIGYYNGVSKKSLPKEKFKYYGNFFK